jgi:3-oxoacyl-[acyl-carrier-protein] synthase II
LRRVLITGLGCVTPCGIGIEQFWNALRAGRSGIDRISSFDPTGCASTVAGEVREFDPRDYLGRREIEAFSRYVHFGVAAARMAWEDAGLPSRQLDADRVGVCVGTAVAASGRIVHEGIVFAEKGIARVHPMLPLQYPGTVASEIAIAFGLHGPAYAVSTACTAGADAAGLAFGQIAVGSLDAAIVGGSEAPIFPVLFAAFDRIQVLSRLNDPPERASRPFSRDRTGFVLSEGAGMLVLEAEDVALRRGARVYAELAGFGATCDAHHHLAPALDGTSGARAVRIALEQAGLAPSDIDYVNAHGTGTQKNDEIETVIMKQVFGERASEVPVSASKSMLGHLIGASAAVELIISTLAIRDGMIPPTINLTEPDPQCDLDYVTEGCRPASLRAVLSTSFGFGSRNAALVVSRYNGGTEGELYS